MRDTMKEYARILHVIKQYRNGETVTIMKNRGANYNANYGLSTFHIKQEAARVGRSQDLACKLWEEDTRDTRLFALYLFEPPACDEAFLDSLVRQFHTLELSQQAAMSVLCDAVISQTLVLTWCRDSCFPVKMAGYSTMIRKIKTCTFAEINLGILFEVVSNDVRDIGSRVMQTVAALLEVLLLADTTRKNEVALFIESMKEYAPRESAYVFDQICYLM